MSYGWRQEDGGVAEICDECGFDSRRVDDVFVGLKAVIAAMHCYLAEPDAARRPGPAVWSAREYADHTVAVVVECLAEVADGTGVSVAATPTDGTGLLRYLEVFVTQCDASALATMRLETPFGMISGTANLLHALHDAEHHLLDIRRGYARLALARGEDLHTTTR